ncbi:PREDICTED: vicilin-like antimicrobial peptides 2-1 [Erythranthe guttata]|uniref:vicilin-like antimicrobial peptides 2-1 n=1 Tax=Erythranthe guttata TaxID=4155 RepID=UPI00064E01D9|nr:PREDICTED: vicilin-like antimicrobial peptides 2-1 [Erythranthe guttata]|eukprot:XP_012832344.1 PREDICTED: vicilin-like antimicrobial peptides 2-1 [Erythranthe guttata]
MKEAWPGSAASTYFWQYKRQGEACHFACPFLGIFKFQASVGSEIITILFLHKAHASRKSSRPVIISRRGGELNVNILFLCFSTAAGIFCTGLITAWAGRVGGCLFSCAAAATAGLFCKGFTAAQAGRAAAAKNATQSIKKNKKRKRRKLQRNHCSNASSRAADTGRTTMNLPTASRGASNSIRRLRNRRAKRAAAATAAAAAKFLYLNFIFIIQIGTVENHHREDEPAAQRFKQCQSRCGKQEQGQQRQYCQQKCQWEYEKQKREEEQQHGGGRGGGDPTNAKKESKEEEKQQRQNPYFFDSQRFDSKYRTEQGHIKILERFSKNSDLLQGIENYRLAILEANPNTFVLPHHCDAESVFLVVGGRGTISYVWEKQRKSYNLKSGGVLWVPAGSIVYLTNNDDNERLYILKLLQPVNTPGKFKEYFGVGGENPESFYSSFSNEILEAAFNTQSEKLQRLFGQQSKGVIIKASKEQIRALSQESESSPRGRREKESSSWGPIDLLNERPVFSNEFGQYFEASPNHYQQLRDLDVSVLLVNITKVRIYVVYCF